MDLDNMTDNDQRDAAALLDQTERAVEAALAHVPLDGETPRTVAWLQISAALRVAYRRMRDHIVDTPQDAPRCLSLLRHMIDELAPGPSERLH